MNLFRRLVCDHHWNFEGELAWFMVAGPCADRYCRLVCKKCGTHRNILLEDWPDIRDKQVHNFKNI